MIKASFPLERFEGRRTPFYCYDMAVLRESLSAIRRQTERTPAFRVHYAVKANFNPVILQTIAGAGLGADCVSGGEIRAALDAGFPASGIVFAGVGKSDEEILLGLRSGISRFNVESIEELQVIHELAVREGRVAPVSLRVNPDIGAHTHADITTGLAENKFGIDYSIIPDVIRQALSMEGIAFKGLHFHIGSQILDMMDFVALCNRINGIQDELERQGLPVGDLNVGGGLGIQYEHPNHFPVADFEAYFDTFRRHLRRRPEQTVHFELGRSVVAGCGSLITRVLYVKQGLTRRFAIVDGSMTELIRPALYKAYHRIENLSSDLPEQTYDVVGPVCESSDVFGRGVSLNECRRGDWVAIRSAGAYGEAMASRYNCHPFPEALFL